MTSPAHLSGATAGDVATGDIAAEDIAAGGFDTGGAAAEDAGTSPQPSDPLEAAASVLKSIAGEPLDRHPELFARFDELLREALDTPAHVSPD